MDKREAARLEMIGWLQVLGFIIGATAAVILLGFVFRGAVIILQLLFTN